MYRCVVISALAVLLGVAPARSEDRTFPLGQFGGLVVDVPPGWTAETQKQDAAGGPGIRLQPPAGEGAAGIGAILLTPMPVPHEVAGVSKELRAAMGEIAEKVKAKAAEPQLPVIELACRGGRVLYVSATDRTVAEPKPGEFKYVDAGIAAVGPLWVTATVLGNVPSGAARERSLAVLRSLDHAPAGAPWRDAKGRTALALPGQRWRLALDLPGWKVGATTPLRSEGVRLEATRDPGWIVTVFLETGAPGETAAAVREAAWKRLQGDAVERVDVRRSERGSMAVLRHRVPTAGGRTVNQEHVNAYLLRGGVWVDVHLSKTNFRPEDEAAVEAILSSLRIEEAPKPSPPATRSSQ